MIRNPGAQPAPVRAAATRPAMIRTAWTGPATILTGRTRPAPIRHPDAACAANHDCGPAADAPIRSPGGAALAPRAAAVAVGLALAMMEQAGAQTALPFGERVVAGQVGFERPGQSSLLVRQGSPGAIVDWQGFSIGREGAVRFEQPDVSSVILNRVVAGESARPSEILGSLSANGRVFLVNPAGVLFAPGANVSVGGLVASTLAISNEDFLAGRYRFGGPGGGTPAAPVDNQGSLAAADRGTVALLGGQVSNRGTVQARLGTVALAAGDRVTLDFAGDGLTQIRVEAGAVRALVANHGLVAADGGRAVLTAQAAGALAATVVNQSGTVRAQSLVERNGQIVLDGGGQGVVRVSGRLDAAGPDAGATGGTIEVRGRQVGVTGGATLDASGTAGGGTVRVGGGASQDAPGTAAADTTYFESGASIRVDATASGDGGQAVVTSSLSTRAHGAIDARGAGGGAGGRVETSGGYLELDGARVAAGAPGGRPGAWLIGAADVNIVETIVQPGVPIVADDPVTQAPTGETSTLATAPINAALDAGTHVTVAAGVTHVGRRAGGVVLQGAHAVPTPVPGDPGAVTQVAAARLRKTGGEPVALTLRARHLVAMQPDTAIEAATGAQPLAVTIESDVDRAGGGPVSLQSGASVATGGGALRIDGSGASASRTRLDTTRADGSGGALSITSTAADGDGIQILFGSTLSSGSGDLTLAGTGRFVADIDRTEGGHGVRIVESTLRTGSGQILLDGTGSGPGHGVWITGRPADDGAAAVIARVQTGDGRIEISGRATGTGGTGVRLGGAGRIGGPDTRGDIVLQAGAPEGGDAMDLAADASVASITPDGPGSPGGPGMTGSPGAVGAIGSTGASVSTAGVLVLRPLAGPAPVAGSGTVALGGSPGARPAALDLSDADLGALDAGAARAIVFDAGEAAGPVVVRGPIALGTDLTLQNDAAGSAAPLDIAAPLSSTGTLALLAGGRIAQSAPIAAARLLASSRAGDIALNRADNTVGAASLAAPAGSAAIASGAPASLTLAPVEAVRFDAAAGAAAAVRLGGSVSSGEFSARALAGNLRLEQPVAARGAGAGITLAAAGVLDNAGGTLAPGAGGRWLVRAGTWEGERRGGLVPTGPRPNLYGCAAEGSACADGAAIPDRGDRFAYAQRPLLTVTPGDASRRYGEPNPALGFEVSGLRADLGDAPSDALAGSLSVSAPANAPVGSHPIVGRFSSPAGYRIEVAPARLVIEPALLTYLADSASRRQGEPNPPLSGRVEGFVAGDTQASATSGTLAFATAADAASAPGRYPVLGSGLQAANYRFEQAAANATALEVVAVSPPPGPPQPPPEPPPGLPPGPPPPLPLADLGERIVAVTRQFARMGVVPEPVRDVTLEATSLYEKNLGAAPMCLATGPLTVPPQAGGRGSDLLDLEWSRVRAKPQVSNCLAVPQANRCSDF